MTSRIGLTGGIASGKTTVSGLFRYLGARIIDADEISHSIIEPGQPAYGPLIEAFGTGILDPEGRIVRQRLRNLVFSDVGKRNIINAIMHPLVRAGMENAFTTYHYENPAAKIIHDIPLLIETGTYKSMDIVILVYVDRATQLSRLINRDRLDPEEAERLLNIQMSLDEKRVFATFIIDNSGTLDQTRIQVDEVFGKLS